MSELTELQVAQLNKTIAKILDELDRAKAAYMSIDADNFLPAELPRVTTTFQVSTLPGIMMMADTAELLVAASKAEEEPTEI